MHMNIYYRYYYIFVLKDYKVMEKDQVKEDRNIWNVTPQIVL